MAERITGHTQLIALLAYPIRHSSSPAIHNEAFAYLGLDYAYLAFDVDKDQLKDAMQGLRALDVAGANLSMPNKTLVCDYLDELSTEAKLIGAVNTVVNDHGKFIGYNTDGVGYMSSLKDNGIDIIGKKITMAGCGGAATAMQVQAALDGVREISIFNIKDAFWDNALETVDKINSNTDCKVSLHDLADLDLLRSEIADSVLFANATGVGMGKMEGQSVIQDSSYLRPDLVVTDTIYSPEETKLLSMAREVGCKRMNGLNMLLFQGAAGFKLWTGQDMPIEHMKEMLGIHTE